MRTILATILLTSCSLAFGQTYDRRDAIIDSTVTECYLSGWGDSTCRHKMKIGTKIRMDIIKVLGPNRYKMDIWSIMYDCKKCGRFEMCAEVEYFHYPE